MDNPSTCLPWAKLNTERQDTILCRKDYNVVLLHDSHDMKRSYNTKLSHNMTLSYDMKLLHVVKLLHYMSLSHDRYFTLFILNMKSFFKGSTFLLSCIFLDI